MQEQRAKFARKLSLAAHSLQLWSKARSGSPRIASEIALQGVERFQSACQMRYDANA